MGRLIVIALAILWTASLNAQRNKKIKGNGNVVTIERATGNYDRISVGGFFEVQLVEGKEGNITLKGEDNILEHIETEVKNKTLTIKKRKNLNLRPSMGEGVFITIPVESINAIRLSGAGKLYSSKTLKEDNFKIRTSGSRNLELALETESITVITSGSSNVRLNGQTRKLDVTSSGSSNVNGYDLNVDIVDTTSSGSSNIKVTANEAINARVSGSSNVKYRGNPEKINTKTSGSGKVNKKN